MASLPLVRGFGAGAAFAYREGKRIDIEQFLGDAANLAASLPERPYLLNLCVDRYRFAVGFAAALLRGQTNLLPPNETPDLIGRLAAQYPGVYCLSDRATGQVQLETIRYPEMTARGPAQAPVPRLPESQVAAIVFTSGSTGQPIPYRKTWGSLTRVALAEIESLGMAAWPGMSVLGTVPPQHVFGLEATVLAVMQSGFALHAGRPFYPADICAELAALPRPRCLVTSPVHLRVLLAEADRLPPVDFVLCATAPLSPQLAAEAESRFAAPLHEIYGCTESGGIASRRTVTTSEWHAMRDVSLRADDKGTWVRGGHVEIEVLLADVIELRDQGRFELYGRTADLVNIAGKRTSLAHLNYHLNSIPGVLDGAFIVPERGDGKETRLAAFVVAPAVSAENVIQALRSRIDAAFLPRPLHLVDALPRNATGKLPRKALDGLAAEVSQRQAAPEALP